MLKKMPREQKQIFIEHIQHFFQVERGETLGELAADQMLEFMLTTIGPLAYNEALKEARAVINERFISLEDEIYSLEKPLKLAPR